jgi:hypothetical protein
MTTVFIAGSITIKSLDARVKERIDKVVESGFDIVVGDADGADAAIQRHLRDTGAKNTTVYCSGSAPRNNVGDWDIQVVDAIHAPGSRAFFTAKDLQMARRADFGLMIWDTRSTGTLGNVIELLVRKKKSVVYIYKDKVFKNVGTVDDLEALVSGMPEPARRKADEKIRLSQRLDELKYEQVLMFV